MLIWLQWVIDIVDRDTTDFSFLC